KVGSVIAGNSCCLRHRNTCRERLPSAPIDPLQEQPYSSAHVERTRLQAGTPAPRGAPAGSPRSVQPPAGREPFAARKPRTAHRREGQPCSAQRAGAHPRRAHHLAVEIPGAELVSAVTSVTVRILDKEYQVACPEEERSALLQSA